MTKRQLVIFEYVDEDYTCTEWFWTTETNRDKINIECYEWIMDANEFTMQEAREFYKLSNYWVVNEAVHEDDIAS